MNVDAANNPYAQMNVGQYYGNTQGGSQNGMKDLMQNLSMEDRTTLRDKMQSLPQEERVAMKAQLKEVDASSMSQDDYFQSLLDILNQDDSVEEATGFSVYA
jgi:hypothetical protein